MNPALKEISLKSFLRFFDKMGFEIMVESMVPKAFRDNEDIVRNYKQNYRHISQIKIFLKFF